ncbi:hypothetical protein, partial [Rossellomorea sp. BNER]|uniref:hypothetical protein n=1 Tax=Rossellomorea sp. BNER TaxID=2962031 RepID=UPI003AF22F35|nr:hypothetical protein [Rossellomorea sp. BNER]
YDVTSKELVSFMITRRLAPAKVSPVPQLLQESRISTPTNFFTKIYVINKQQTFRKQPKVKVTPQNKNGFYFVP